MIASGAKPMGVQGESDAAQAVQQMFNTIAPRYDLLNHVLSANIDRLWWRRAARAFRSTLADPNAAILDICCGTGDLTLALLKHRPASARPILAADFAHAMLSRGSQKFGAVQSGRPRAIALEADALHLPVRSQSLDLVITAFGFRNLANYEAGLREFHRVLKPGGRLGILEFSQPAVSSAKPTPFTSIASCPSSAGSSAARTARTTTCHHPWALFLLHLNCLS